MPSILEIMGFITGIAGVYLTIQRSPFCWPVSGLNVLLYGKIFYDARLYADMGLQAIFFAFSIYGWIAWTTNAKSYEPDDSPLKVKKSSYVELLIGLLITIPSAMLIGYVLMSQTNADVPYIDSILASLSIWAQILQTRKRLENWYLWIAVDAVYILIYVQKELYLSSILYLVFLILAIKGAIEWRKVLLFSAKDLA